MKNRHLCLLLSCLRLGSLTAFAARKPLLLACLILVGGGTAHAQFTLDGTSTTFSDLTTNISGIVLVGNDAPFTALTLSNNTFMTNHGDVYVGFGNTSDSNRVVITSSARWGVYNYFSLGQQGAFNTLLITNGGTMSTYGAEIGQSGHNLATVSGANSVWHNRTSMVIGSSGAFNTLLITNGGTVTGSDSSDSSDTCVIGLTANASNNAVMVSGPNSAWINSGYILVGELGAFNTLLITSGGTVTNTGGYIGGSPTADNNAVTVSGPNSAWICGALKVGDQGPFNTLLITNGGVVNSATGDIGYDPGASNNAVAVSGPNSAWNISSGLTVGGLGAFNKLVITNGGAVSDNQGYIGANTTGSNNAVTVNGSGSVWNNSSELTVGKSSAGNRLFITSGAVVQANGAFVGFSSSSTNNRVTVANGTLTATNASATAALDIRRGTNVLNAGLIEADTLLLNNPLGVFEFNGGTLITRGASISNGQDFVVGLNAGFAPATWDVRSNAVPTTVANNLYIGSNAPNATMLITNGGTVSSSGGEIGFNPTASNSVVTVSGPNSAWHNSGDLTVGHQGSFNTLFIANGGTVANADGYLGDSDHNTVTVSGAGSAWNTSSYLFVGAFGSFNTLLVTNGGTASSDYFASIGFQAVAQTNAGVVSGPNSVWNSRIMNVGEFGSFNTLLIANGGTVASLFGAIGSRLTSSNNAVTVSGPNSAWICGALTVGDQGPFNTLMITNGGVVNSATGDIGYDPGASNNAVAVSGPNSAWNISSGLTVGGLGAFNTLLITSGGLVQANGAIVGMNFSAMNNRVTVANGTLSVTNASATAALDIRRGTNVLNAGLIEADTLLLNNPLGFFEYHGGTLNVRNSTVANGQPFFVGDGGSEATLNLVGNGGHTYANGLTLRANGTLTGNGTITGLLTVASGGTLAPGNNTVGTISISTPPSLLGTVRLEVSQTGTLLSNDVVTVAGTLTYGGALVVTNLGPDALVAGNHFKLFNATSYAGSFASLTLPPLTRGLGWTNQLLVDGSLEVFTIPPGDRYWTNDAGGKYQTDANWNPNLMPSILDNANFTNNASYQVAWAADAVASNAFFSAASGVVTQAVGGFTWQVTNSYVLGPVTGQKPTVQHSSGTLRVANAAGNATLDIRRGTNVLNAGLVDADRLLLTNTLGNFQFNGGTLITRGATITNGQDFVVGLNAGFAPATWDVRSNSVPTAMAKALYIGFNAANASLLITNGATVQANDGVIGESSAHNAVTVSGANSAWNSASLVVGDAGAFNTLRITNGGTVNNFFGYIGVSTNASQNAVTVLGTNSAWNSSDFVVGYFGASNTLLIAGGGTVADTDGDIGHDPTASNNTVTVSGGNSVWTNSDNLIVGDAGAFNTLLITNGGTVANAFGYIGFSPSSSHNAVTVSDAGSVWNSTILMVGSNGGFNTLLIANGGTVGNNYGYLGEFSANNLVAVSGANSVWNCGGLYVGDAGAGNTLLVTNGGAVRADFAFVGFDTSATNNRVTVANGTLTVTNAPGTAALDIRRGTNVLNAGLIEADQLLLTNTLGSFEFNGGSLNVRNSTVADGQPFYVGDGGNAATLNLVGNGVHSYSNGLTLRANGTLTGNGSITGLVTVPSGGTLAPGNNTVGTISISTPPSLSGTVRLELSQTGALLTNDVVTVAGTLIYGGALVITNLGPDALAGGDNFKLFNATSYAGSFASLTLPPLTRGLVWTNKLLVDGSLEVFAIPPGDRYWTNDAGGNYQTDANWNPNLMPAILDNANFTDSASYQVAWTTDAVASKAIFSATSGTVTQAVGGFTWQLTNSYVLGPVTGQKPTVQHSSGTLRVANAAGNATLDIRRGTNVLNSGVVEADRLLLTNTLGNFQFNGGTLITRGATITNGQDFMVGLNAGFAPATWDVRSNAVLATLSKALYIGYSAPNATLLITNGGRVDDRFSYIGNNTSASHNTVTVSGPNSAWNSLNNLDVGELGAFNSLLITNGGNVSSQFGFIGFYPAASNNVVTVSGAGSAWNSINNLDVGESGAFNTLLITNGGTVNSPDAYIGVNPTASNNAVMVSGPNSAWNSASLVVGNSGAFNTLLIADGGMVTNNIDDYIGIDPTANHNAVSVSGANSAWNNNSGVLYVGDFGSFNTLLITNGGTVGDGLSFIGAQTNASNNLVTVSGANSVWNSGGLYVGYSGAGNTLLVTNGGAVRADFAFVGFNPSATNNRLAVESGTLTVTNAAATATLDIRRGTSALNAGLIEADQLLLTNTLGSFQFNGGTLLTRSATINNGSGVFTNSFSVGLNPGFAPATWNVRSNAVPTTVAGNLFIGSNAPNATLLITNGGRMASGGGLLGFQLPSGSNTVVVSGFNSAWTNDFGFIVGYASAFNTLLITNGGAVGNYDGIIGRNATASNNAVIVSGASSAWINQSALNIGYDGAFNALLVTNGGTVRASGVVLGSNGGSTNNRVTLANGTLTVTNAGATAALDIRRGTNVFNGGLLEADALLLTNTVGFLEFNGGTLITRGATISNGKDFVVGLNAGFAPATWNVRSGAAPISMLVDLYIGSNAPGASLLVTNGATLGNSFGFLGYNLSASNSAVTVSGGNSKWNCLNSLYAGFSGAANTLLIANGGNVTGNFGLVGNNATSSNNTVTVSGPNTSWKSSSSLKFGNSGAFNLLFITNGGTVVDTSGFIGYLFGSSHNTVTVSGGGSAWNNSSSLTVGNQGAFNTLLILNGGVVNNTSALFGFSTTASNSVVAVSGGGSLWNNTSTLTVGYASAFNALLITNAGVVIDPSGLLGYLPSASNNTVTVSGAGSAWNNSGSLVIGSNSVFNTLLITNGGLVTDTFALLGFSQSASNNAVTVNGAGSAWNNSSTLTIGQASAFNRLLLTNGGAVRADSVIVSASLSSTNNRVTVANGILTVTNGSAAAALDIRRGTNVLNAGLIEADTLLLTNTLGGFDFNGGTLNVRASTVANARAFLVGDGTSAATLNLVGNGVHTYANGLTLRANGALVGNGSITGTLTVQSGGTLAPGNSLGKISLSAPPSFSGTVRLEVSRTGALLTNDVVAVTGTLTYGGALVVTNIGPDPLVLGSSFKLFNATSFAGSFASLTLPALASGLTWANKLLADGSVAVITNSPPVIATPFMNGTNLIFSVTGGTPGGAWNLLTTTNLALPVVSWSTNRSGVFDALGNVTLTNGILYSEPQRCYRITTP